MIADISERLERYFREEGEHAIYSAYLFGSHAAGRFHRESDVDIAVLLDRSRLPSRRERADFATGLNADLVHVLGRNEVDLVVLNDVPPELGRAVVQKGVRVYCADSEADHVYVRDVQLRAADLAIFLDRMRAIKLERLRA